MSTTALTAKADSQARADLFGRLVGVAMVAHVVGNWRQPDLPELTGWLEFGVGLLGIALAIKPGRVILFCSSLLVVASVVAEMPFLGNHWLLAGLVCLGIVLTRVRSQRYLILARWVFAIFYAFAAFAKLNTAFFDPSVSCAVFYANQNLSSWGLPAIATTSRLAALTILGTVLMEASIVPLLLLRRTRYYGIVLACVFHGLISFDLNQHFYDFTSVLYALVAAWLPEETAGAIEARLRSTTPRVRALARLAWILSAGVLVSLAVLPPNRSAIQILASVPFGLWIPFSILCLFALVRLRRLSDGLAADVSPAIAFVVALAVLNGVTPYFELKTAYGFNMYANLVTARGETNHLVVPRTLPWRKGYEGPVEIRESSDLGLEAYLERGYLIAYPEFQQYLVGRSVSVTYRRDGVESSIDDTSIVPGLASAGPWWWRFMPLRAIDEQVPPRCQDVFLPAL